MYSSEFNVIPLIKNQYKLKLRAYSHFFSILILTDVLMLLISLGGLGGGGFSSELVILTRQQYSSILFFFVTFINTIGIAFSLTSREARNMDFSFISSRLTSNVSNLLVLVTFSIAAGVITILFSFTLRVAAFYLTKDTAILTGFHLPLDMMLYSMISTILYVFFIGSITCFISNMFEYNKVFIILFPMLMVAIFVSLSKNFEFAHIFPALAKFFAAENSLFLFALKILSTSLLMLLCGGFATNRIEVRK